jgi:hypothetical protein
MEPLLVVQGSVGRSVVYRVASTDSDYRASTYLRSGTPFFTSRPCHLRFKPSEPPGYAFYTGCYDF